MVAVSEAESISVMVHLSLTCDFRRKYDWPYPMQAFTPLGSLVKFMVPYFTLS
jgi:hypothetical protein